MISNQLRGILWIPAKGVCHEFLLATGRTELFLSLQPLLRGSESPLLGSGLCLRVDTLNIDSGYFLLGPPHKALASKPVGLFSTTGQKRPSVNDCIRVGLARSHTECFLQREASSEEAKCIFFLMKGKANAAVPMGRIIYLRRSATLH